jgi:DNA polymerase III alpha subunit (gram-positive type)
MTTEETKPQAYSQQHWNNKMMCVMDTETTGLDPNFHELVQVCIIALDSNFNPLKGVIPFYVNLKPNFPERVDPKAIEINKMDMAKIMSTGFDRDKAIDMLEAWIGKLGIRGNKYGGANKIMPLGQNYQFDMGFIKAWLGVEQYNEWFDYHYRDTMTTALFLKMRPLVPSEAVILT